MGYGMCYRTSQKCRVLWCDRHRTHRREGYCGATVTELPDISCRAKQTVITPGIDLWVPYRTFLSTIYDPKYI